jgi:hypothetical protein
VTVTVLVPLLTSAEPANLLSEVVAAGFAWTVTVAASFVDPAKRSMPAGW